MYLTIIPKRENFVANEKAIYRAVSREKKLTRNSFSPNVFEIGRVSRQSCKSAKWKRKLEESSMTQGIYLKNSYQCYLFPALVKRWHKIDSFARWKEETPTISMQSVIHLRSWIATKKLAPRSQEFCNITAVIPWCTVLCELRRNLRKFRRVAEKIWCLVIIVRNVTTYGELRCVSGDKVWETLLHCIPDKLSLSN